MVSKGEFRPASVRTPQRRGRACAAVGALAFAATLALPALAQEQPGGSPQPVALPSPSAAGVARAPAPTLREGVAAVVNDEIISTYDLRQRVLLLIVTSGLQVTDENLREIQREALRSLIDERLQLQEVRRIEARTKTRLEPSASELTEQIGRLAQQNGVTGQQLIDSLAQAGVDKNTLAAQLHAEIAWQRYVGGRFGGSVKIGSDQIEAALKRAQAASSKTQYQVGEIFIESQRAGGEQQALAAARQLVSQIQQGAPFAAVARQFSNAATSSSGGDAGWLAAGDMPLALEQALEQMRPGQVSQPIPVNGGVYLVMLRDKRSGVGATMVNLKQAAVRLAADASPADVEAAKAKLEALRPKVNSCAALDTESAKVQGVVAGDLGETDINDLSQTFRDAIANLKIGEVSQPVRTNAGLHLVALCDKHNTGPAQLTREDIEDRLTEQELEMIARRELRNLRNSASIESR